MGTTAPSPPSRVLVVASDPETRARICEALGGLPLTLEEASGAREALAAAEREAPDLVISDMILRDLTGIGFCRLVRETPGLTRAPFVMVSSFVHEMDRVLAFEAGVDDFVAKPFYKRELASRAGAILRRMRSRGPRGDGAAVLDEGRVRFDPERGRLEVAGQRVDLTPKEFEILSVLVRNEGRVLSRERLVHEVWGRPISDPRVVDAHIKAIRRKLGEASEALETVRGVGFRFRGRGEARPAGGGGATAGRVEEGDGAGPEGPSPAARRQPPRPRAETGWWAPAHRNSG